MNASPRPVSARNAMPLITAVVILVVIIMIGVFCYTRLELVETTRWKSPSREAQANPYLALDRWLASAGLSVRVLSSGTIGMIPAGEQTVFMECNRVNWAGSAAAVEKTLVPWARNGGRLIVSIDTYENPDLEAFMEALGLKLMSPGETEAEEAETENPEAEERETKTELLRSFFNSWRFQVIEKKPFVDRILIMKGLDKSIGLVKLETGGGWVVFTAGAAFLHNYTLTGEGAALAGNLFLEAPDRKVLFVRGLAGERRFFGNLAERGNPAALLAALALVIITGFWMVLPPFGRYRPETEKPGKPLRERFLAEGRFLKKYGALDRYLEAYERELEQRRRIAGNTVPGGSGIEGSIKENEENGDSKDNGNSESAIKIDGATGGKGGGTERAPDKAERLRFTVFLKAQKTLTEELARLEGAKSAAGRRPL